MTNVTIDLNAQDLVLRFRFTDRGGKHVYDVMQHLLSSSDKYKPQTRFRKIGEVRLSDDDIKR